MATRNELEQEALRHTQKGNYSKAARIYHAILRQQPRDRRVRQKLGEIYLKMGQKKEGAKYLREVAGLAQREGQHRVAISIYRQLAQLLDDDLEIIGALADCYRQNNQLHEANKVYEKALNLAKGARAWDRAVEYGTALSEMTPSDMALRFTIAELRESSGDIEGAIADYRGMAAAFTRRGEMGEVARVAEAALRLGEGDPDAEFLTMAIRARVDTGDFDRALENAKPIIDTLEKQRPEVIEALGIALLKRGEESKARRLFLEVAVRYRDVGDSEGQARALELALQAGSDDPKLREAMAQARSRAEKLKRRLTDEAMLSPASDDELIICTKAEVQARYGFPDRAVVTLKAGAKQFPRSYCIGARRVETLLELGHQEEAITLLERMVRSASAGARTVLASRLLILGGPDLLGEPAADPADEIVDEELIDDDGPEMELLDDGDEELLDDDDEELLTDDDLEADTGPGWTDGQPDVLDEDELFNDDALDGGSALARAEALVASEDFDAAIAAFQDVFREDPLNDEVLMRIAEVRRMQREARERAAAGEQPPAGGDLDDSAAPDTVPGADDDDLGDLGFAQSATPSTLGSGGPPMAGLGTKLGAASATPGSSWKELLGGGKKDSEVEPAAAAGSDHVEVTAVDSDTAWALAAVGALPAGAGPGPWFHRLGGTLARGALPGGARKAQAGAGRAARRPRRGRRAR